MTRNALLLGALFSASLLPACHNARRGDRPGPGVASARPTPSIVGAWYLQTVHTKGQLSNGSPPFRTVVHVRPGANACLYTADHKVARLDYGDRGDERAYRVFGDSLVVTDSANVFRERILTLTPTRLVTVTVADRPEGHFTLTTTFKRTCVEELEDLKLEFLNDD